MDQHGLIRGGPRTSTSSGGRTPCRTPGTPREEEEDAVRCSFFCPKPVARGYSIEESPPGGEVKSIHFTTQGGEILCTKLIPRPGVDSSIELNSP